jgi:hypothetical protein
MDRVKAILQCQWNAYWRRFRRPGSFKKSNVGVLVLLGGMGVVRYLQALPGTSAQLARGETARYETLLTIAFLVWLLPVMSESRRSITSRELLHFPLTLTELFAIRLASVFFSPATWIIVVCSLALGYPLAASAHPLTGAAALVLLLLLGVFTSLLITHLLNSALIRKLSLPILFAVSVALAFLWFRKVNFLKSVLPAGLAADAAVSTSAVSALLGLALLTVVALLLSLWTFGLSLQPRHGRRSSRSPFFDAIELPGRFGGIIKKDLGYSSRLLDIYLALPIVVFANMYITSDPSPSPIVFWVLIALLFLPCVSIAFNSFGLDTPLGLDRYTLFPLSGREILLSKNLTFAIVMLILFVASLPLTLWQLGAGVALAGFAELIILVLAYATYGNWLSVRQPFKMQFYRFASGGSAVDVLMGMIFCAVPSALTIYWLYHERIGALWKIFLLMLLFLALYLFSLARSARIFESQRELIRRALS